MSDENNLRNAYIDYSPAMLRVTVNNEPGDLENGAAFHIGNGVVVPTATTGCRSATLAESLGLGSLSAISTETRLRPRMRRKAGSKRSRLDQSCKVDVKST
jgi:hypothetical protein